MNDSLVINPTFVRNELPYMNDYRNNRKGLKNRQQNVCYIEVLVGGWPHIFVLTTREIQKGEV